MQKEATHVGKLRQIYNFHVFGRSGGRTLHKKRPPNRKSFLKYAWRLCRVKRLNIVLREGATHVGKLRLIYDFHVFGRSGGRTLHKKKTSKQEVFFKIRVETLPSKTIKYRFTRGKNPRRSGGRTLHKKRPPNRKSFLKYAWRDSNPRPFGS